MAATTRPPSAAGSLIRGSLGATAALVGALMGLGVLATLGREVLLAMIFGTSRELEMFRLAFAVPNVLGTSLGAVVVSALVPVLSGFGSDKDSQAAALRQAMVATGLMAVVLSVIGALTAPAQVALMAPGFEPEERSRLTPIVAALWGFFGLTALSFGPRAFLSLRGIVWPMASANLVLGGTMALGLLVIAGLPEHMRSAGSLGVVAVVAALVLLVVHLAATPRRVLKRVFSTSVPAAGSALKLAGAATLAAFGGHLLGAIPRLIDRSVATELVPGTVAALDFSFSMITVPGIAFGIVFVISAQPRFAAAASAGDVAGVRRLAWLGGISVALAGAFGVVLMAGAEPVVRLLFGRGAFDEQAVQLTARIVWWHALALGPMVAAIILSQAVLSAGLLRLFLLGSLLRPLVKWIGVEVLVPAHGISGLAASFLLPEFVATGLFLSGIVLWYRSQLGRGAV